jgi:hypothetical protein
MNRHLAVQLRIKSHQAAKPNPERGRLQTDIDFFAERALIFIALSRR